MLTACGIETLIQHQEILLFDILVATVLTACGIETCGDCDVEREIIAVATVLTACGIETYWQLAFASC